jgi:hypothetical protein
MNLRFTVSGSVRVTADEAGKGGMHGKKGSLCMGEMYLQGRSVFFKFLFKCVFWPFFADFSLLADPRGGGRSGRRRRRRRMNLPKR